LTFLSVTTLDRSDYVGRNEVQQADAADIVAAVGLAGVRKPGNRVDLSVTLT